jgi:hypothetical protein
MVETYTPHIQYGTQQLDHAKWEFNFHLFSGSIFNLAGEYFGNSHLQILVILVVMYLLTFLWRKRPKVLGLVGMEDQLVNGRSTCVIFWHGRRGIN